MTAVIQDAAMRIILNNNKKSIGLDIRHCKLSIGHSYKKKNINDKNNNNKKNKGRKFIDFANIVYENRVVGNCFFFYTLVNH